MLFRNRDDAELARNLHDVFHRPPEDGDLVERIASEWPYSGEAEPPTLTELYDEISGSDACIIDSDGNMIPAQRMGAAALKALGLSLEYDDQ